MNVYLIMLVISLISKSTAKNEIREGAQQQQYKKEVAQQPQYKKVEFGFNTGYLGDLQDTNLYRKPLAQIKKDGITRVRVYEPFTKKVVAQPGLPAKLLQPVVQSGFQILLSISNYPAIPSIKFDESANTPEQNQLKSFTNRNAPINMDAYQTYLSDFLDDLQSKNILNSISFEIGNEPDAKKYFWGKQSDFIRIAQATKTTLAKYNKQIYCCGFTSNFANEGATKDKSYYDFLNTSFFDEVNLSFHYYQNTDSKFSKIKLPRLDNAIISEFNMFSHQNPSTVARTNKTNSAEFGNLLINALTFAYKNNIKAIYLFNLVDFPKKEGNLGFFTADGSPKNSYKYFLRLKNVIQDGYYIKEDTKSVSIVGKNETIVFAYENGVALPNDKQVEQASKTLASKNLSANNWAIIKN